jgi:hypothetical protein
LFRNFVHSRKGSIYFLTETWLSADIDSSCFGLPSFQIFRRDRTSDAHGGVAILVENSLKCREVDLRDVEYEITAVDLSGVYGSCRCVCAYRPPSMGIIDTVSFFDEILSLTNSCKSAIVCGDFNVPSMVWDPLVPGDRYADTLLDFLFIGGFSQFVKEFTHRSGHVLDLVFGSDERIVSGVDVCPSFSDHFSVFFNLCFLCSNPCEPPVMRNFNKCENFLDYLVCLNWDSIFSVCNNCEDFWEVFSDAVKIGVDKFVPFFPVKGRCKARFDLSPQTRDAKEHKLNCYKNYKRYKTIFWKKLLRFWTVRVSRLVKLDLAVEEYKIADANDPKRFFSYVKSVFGRSHTIPDIVFGGVVISDPVGKANAFNDYFCSVFTVDDGHLPRFGVRTHSSISNVVFTADRIVRAFKKLHNSFSSGPDQIPAILLKKCSSFLIEPLRRLFTVVFAYGIPHEWLLSDVTPLYKGSGSISCVGSYRPISVRPSVCKLMEIVVKDVMLEYLISNSLLVCDQHGFVPKKSTVTELLECISEWASEIDSGHYVDVVFIDFRKAFDSVVHSKLLHKCERYGFTGDLLNFLGNFLSNSFQRVKIENIFLSGGRFPVVFLKDQY